MPSKKGYALASNGTGLFDLAPVEERALQTRAIRLWLKCGSCKAQNRLLSIDQQYKLSYTSEPIYFDLLAGKVVPSGGDVKLTVNRSPGVISGRNRLDWSLQIEAVDGGLMDSGGQESSYLRGTG